MSLRPQLPDEVVTQQSGVTCRPQLFTSGWSDHDIRRELRRRELATVFPGVYVNHTGSPSWLQRAWAATLAAAPAALSHSSAIEAARSGRVLLPEETAIHLVVARDRHVKALPGVVLHRRAHLDELVLWNASPPRLRVEHAALDLAACAPNTHAAFEALAVVVRERLTTPARLLVALERRPRLHQRALLTHFLQDLDQGSCSLLERAFVRNVEQAHGLPSSEAQVAAAHRGRIYRDRLYPPFDVGVELDGHAFHSSPSAHDRDLDRDLGAAADHDILTVRLGWGQVFARACETAVSLGKVLRRRGWWGRPTPCANCG